MRKPYSPLSMTPHPVRRLKGPLPSKDNYLRTGPSVGFVVAASTLYRWLPLHQKSLGRVK